MRELRVGLLVLLAMVALAVGIFVIGDQNNLFTRKNYYYVHFETVSGLAEGNPVQLNGVTVGHVSSIELPEDADQALLTVNVRVDRRFADRVRADSEARIKTLGLLGDRYVQITSGSPELAAVPNGGEVKAAEATDVDELIASGENAVDNFVAISVSLREILARMESGQGILGQLTSDSETGTIARDKLVNILTSLENMTRRAEQGQGSLGRLLADDALVVRMESTLARIESNLASVETGDGLLALLVNDAATKDRFIGALDTLSGASEEIAALSRDLREGDGLLPRLISDEEFGRRVSGDLERLLDNLSTISGRLEAGEGAVGQMINDPAIYEAMQDIVVGIEESKFLSWLIRNRQKKGIKKRYDEAQAEAAPQGEPR